MVRNSLKNGMLGYYWKKFLVFLFRLLRGRISLFLMFWRMQMIFDELVFLFFESDEEYWWVGNVFVFPSIDSVILSFYFFQVPLSNHLNFSIELFFGLIFYPKKRYHRQLIFSFINQFWLVLLRFFDFVNRSRRNYYWSDQGHRKSSWFYCKFA